MLSTIVLCAYIVRVCGRDDVKHIGTHKFRFNDEILEVNQNVINHTRVPSQQPKQKVNLEKANELFKKSVYTKTYICDPDGILSELEQEKINQKLIKSINRIFAALSHNILVETGNQKQQSQVSFGGELLKKYSESSHSEYKDSILISYVEEFQTLKIIVGGINIKTNIHEKQEFITQLEDEFNKNQKETYQSLEKVIEELNTQLKRSSKSELLAIVIWHKLKE
ncbi:conserved hypothetical protein [Theileria orientalis strain Shintoku]|uniref:Uncharacterized protein n=1 Tax=Theileria orientalis strain Shintoku TaxID=869250 RepID=J4CCI4_THEOR|nr:conserved hypothetical protein [Theileria orientalis strain Shintoku]BAM39447.1 conserved hypothetical protein [Theileria orientalis strain Shintoku]|eukprot:XP_009689748.1 conserved hypothetical protein [Theileria orientalis strain Shintoku]